jgi:hypothetical protein
MHRLVVQCKCAFGFQLAAYSQCGGHRAFRAFAIQGQCVFWVDFRIH